jgi:DDE family transposase
VLSELQRLLPLSRAERQRTILRMDAGFGTDANLAYLLPHDYQLLVKGFSAGRAAAHARRISTWTELRAQDTWAAFSPIPLQLARPSRTLVLKQRTPSRDRHALLLTTLIDLELAEIVALYEDRGQIEVEIQSDKMGLLIARRRKHSMAGQELLILLNDWVHNLLALLHASIFQASPFATFGPKRLIRDVLSIPGTATFVDGQLTIVHLSVDHPYADAMVACLSRLISRSSQTM